MVSTSEETIAVQAKQHFPHIIKKVPVILSGLLIPARIDQLKRTDPLTPSIYQNVFWDQIMMGAKSVADFEPFQQFFIVLQI